MEAIVHLAAEIICWVIGTGGLVLVGLIWRGVFDDDVPG